MGDRSRIEWTDRTWNPVTGCTKVSPGCEHCYAQRITERFHGLGAFAQVRVHPDRLEAPLRWRRPSRVFVNSMSDLFHPAVPDDTLTELFTVMARAGRHTFQVLTKRHGRMRSLLDNPEFRRAVLAGVREADPHRRMPVWPLPNVWLGVSVEDQQRAELRVPALLDTPAAVRFLSCEPLLGSVAITAWLAPEPDWIDWVIVGGESGPHARPMRPEWARSLRNQCTAAGVGFFFKQWGEWAPHNPHDTDRPGPGAVELARVGRKTAGRVLDGRTWDEFPQEVTRS